MSTIPHRIHHDLYRGPKILRDPGDGGIIRVTADLQVCEMTSGSSGETRTLANPTKPGIRFHLRLLTDGGGNVVVTAANGLNASLETEATFADAGDFLELVSVTLTPSQTTPTYRWEDISLSGITSGGVVVSSTSPSSSASTSPSASASSSPSSSPSAT